MTGGLPEHNVRGSGRCRSGAGVEENYGKGDTPGFPLNDRPKTVRNPRGFLKFVVPRNNRVYLQTSLYALQGWRGNCDIQILLRQNDEDYEDKQNLAISIFLCTQNIGDFYLEYLHAQ